jgi:hypothetical protein
VNRDGYPRISPGGGSRKRIYVARAVLELKLGRPVRPGFDACHSPSCISRACVEASHLREDTRKGNIADAVKLGRMNGAPGVRNVNAKLTPSKVKAIKKLLLDGHSYAEIGRWYGVVYTAISSIDHGRTWKEVK